MSTSRVGSAKVCFTLTDERLLSCLLRFHYEQKQFRDRECHLWPITNLGP